MAKIETWFDQDLKQAVKVRYIDGNVFSADNNGNIVGVNVYDNGEPATLGGSVSASIVRSDGVTVSAVGSLSGNKVSVTLPQSAYAVPGVISIVLKLTDSTTITTVCAVVGNVYQSTTDTVVDPGTIIPSVETLIAEIEAAVATIPADYSTLWTSLASAFSSSNSYTIGQYVTYNGGLYRFTANHSGSWASGDVTSVSLGTDLADARGRITSAETDLADAKADIVDIQGDITNIQGDITDIQGDLSDTEDDIADAKSELSDIGNSLKNARYGFLEDTITVGYFTFERGSINPTTGADDDTQLNRGRTDYITVPDGCGCVCINKSTTSYYTRLFAYDSNHSYLGRFYDSPNNTKYIRIWCQPKGGVTISTDVMHDEIGVFFFKSNKLSTWTFGTPVNNYIVESESVTASVYSDYIVVPKGIKLVVSPVRSCTVGYYKYSSDRSVFLEYAYKTNNKFEIIGDGCAYRLHMTDSFDSPYVLADVGAYANASLELACDSDIALNVEMDTVNAYRISADSNLIAHVASLAFKNTKAYAVYYADDEDMTEPSVLGTEYLAVSEFYPDTPYNHTVHVILKKGDNINGQLVRGNVREPVAFSEAIDNDTLYILAEAGTGVSDVDYFKITLDVSTWEKTIAKCTLDNGSFGVTTLGKIVKVGNAYYAGLGGYTEHFPAKIITSSDLVAWTTVASISDAFIYAAGTTEAATEYCKEVNIEYADNKLFVAFGVNREKEQSNPRTDNSYRGAYYAVYDLSNSTMSASSEFLANGDTCASFRPMVFRDNRNVYAAVIRSKHYWYYDALKNSTRPRSCMGFFVWNGTGFEFFDSIIDKSSMHYIFPIPFLFQLYAVFSSDPRNVNWQKGRSGIYFAPLNIGTLDKPYIKNTQESPT